MAGVTKAAISKARLTAEEAFGVSFLNGRSKLARSNMAKAQRKLYELGIRKPRKSNEIERQPDQVASPV